MELITIREAVEISGRTERTVRRWIAKGRVHSILVAPRYRVIIADSLPGSSRGRGRDGK